MPRRVLPPRRATETTSLRLTRNDGAEIAYDGSVGLDRLGYPKEIFLSGAKDGSDMASLLADVSIVLSVALQWGVPPSAMAKSIGRAPIELDGPAVRPVSILGAALDLLVEYEMKS